MEMYAQIGNNELIIWTLRKFEHSTRRWWSSLLLRRRSLTPTNWSSSPARGGSSLVVGWALVVSRIRLRGITRDGLAAAEHSEAVMEFAGGAEAVNGVIVLNGGYGQERQVACRV